MGKITHLVLHCSATPESSAAWDAERVLQIAIEKGWSHYGYHRVIEYDGTIVKGQALDADDFISPHEVANGAYGLNQHAVHICYVGGMKADMSGPKDTRTDAQLQAMYEVVRWCMANWPGIKVIGHNEVANKACPSFDVQEWLQQVGVI